MVKKLEIVDDFFDASIKQESSETCWAACIEMICKFKIKEKPIKPIKPTTQERILKELRLLVNQESAKRIPSFGDYYLKIFNSDLLKSLMGCEQFQFKMFPKPDFIKNYINGHIQSPLILSGIKYPLSGFHSRHAITIYGYKEDIIENNIFENSSLNPTKNIFWLLAADPRDTFNTYKVAIVYNTLIEIQDRRNIKNLITGFGKKTSEVLPIPMEFNNYELIDENNYASLNSKDSIVRHTRILEESKSLTLHDFFGLEPHDISRLKEFTDRQLILGEFPRYKYLNENFEETTTLNIIFSPIILSDKIKLEFVYIKNKSKSNSYQLIAITQTFGIDKILSPINKIGTEKFYFDHSNKNYKIFDYLKIYRIVYFEHENVKYYMPISDIKISTNSKYLKAQHAYKIEELKSINKPLATLK